MSKVMIIPPHRDLIRSVADLLSADGTDYSKNLVVFPGRRPAHFLRKVIAGRENRPFIPPRVLSIEELIDEVGSAHSAVPVRKIDTLDAVGILFDLHLKQNGRMGGEHFVDLDRFFPLGEKLFTELEEMKMAMLSPQLVAEQTSVVDYANLFTIAELYESFYRVLERDGLTTRAREYARAATSFQAEDIAQYDRVILAGLYAFTQSEQVLVRAIHACEQSRFLFVQGPGLVHHVSSLGLEYEQDHESTEGPAYEFVRSPDLHGQIAALAASVHRSMAEGGETDERNVLVLPRPDALFPVMNHFLPLFSEDGYNVSMGYPLTRTPLSGLFHSLSEAIARKEGDRWFVPDYLRVMLHPYVKSVRFNGRSDVTRILIHTVEEWLADAAGRSLRDLREIESSDELFTSAVFRVGDDNVTAEMLRVHLRSIHDILFHGFSEQATLGEFAERCKHIVRFIHEQTTATHHPYFRSFSDTMMEGLELLLGSLIASKRMGSLASSFALLHHIVRTRNVPFPGSPLHGFQVLGLLETRGLAFENVYVVEANDDVLPGSSGPDHLLPESVRATLGMDTHREREQIIAYYLSVLLAGAKRVWIAWNEADGKEKSRYVEQLLWRHEKDWGEITRPDAVPLVRYGLSLEPDRPKPVQKTEMDAAAIGRRSLSAGALDTYLRCQLRFYYGYVLGLSSPEDLSGEIEQADIGNLVHDVLQSSLRDWKGRPMVPEELDVDAISQAAEEAFDERFGTPSSAATLLMRERISHQISQFVSEYQRPLASRTSITISSLEETLEGTIGNARFRVRTDRVEERTDAEGQKTRHILDYKTGGNPSKFRINLDVLDPDDRSTWVTAIGSFQLFLYTVLHARSQKIDEASVDAAYIFLGIQTIDDSIEVGLFDREEMNKGEKLGVLENIVHSLVDEMRDPAQPFSPTAHVEEECPHCPFTTICGTTWTEKRGEW